MDWVKGKPKYKLYDNIKDLPKITFWCYSNESKKNTYIMLCSHCPISDSLEATLQASRHTAEGN